MARIEKLNDGTYRSRAYIGRTSEGKTITRTVRGMTKRELQKNIAALRAKYGSTRGSKPLGAAIYKFVQARSDLTIYSPTTYTGYLSNFRSLETYIPDYMTRDMRFLTTNDMEQIFMELSLHLAPKTLKNIRGVLSGTFKMAGYAMPELNSTTNRLLSNNRKMPISVTAVKETDLTFDRYFPTNADIIGVLQYASEHREDLKIPIALAAYCGLRRSEICGLVMSDFNRKDMTVSIRRAMVVTNDREYVYKGTKTKNSRRIVPVPSELIDMIFERGSIYDKTPKSLSDAWEHVVSGAFREGLTGGIFRFHDLRHFAAAWWMTDLHFDIATCMDLGGWSEQDTLLKIYAYVLDDVKKEAFSQINHKGNEMLKAAKI